jgi:hypothetical protein
MTHSTIDLEYTEGLYYRFYPLTAAGRKVWNELADQSCGVMTETAAHAPALIQRLRQAGYRLRKLTPQDVDIDTLAKELGL